MTANNSNEAGDQQQAQVPALFTPLTIRGVTLKNRIVIAPMCQYSAQDGFVNTWHVQHIGSRIVGGASLFIVEATAVVPEGRISINDLGIWKDEHIEGFKNIADFAHSQNAHIGIQLAHSGRKGSTVRLWEANGRDAVSNEDGGFDVVGPSNVPYDEFHKIPHELSLEEVEGVIESFVSAAKRAVAAGFDVIEIHGAHGYLLHSFYSPKSNFRTDKYGGSFENRTRLIVEVCERVRAVIPQEMPLFTRLSATDYVEDGWTVDDHVELSKLLKNVGVDLIDCSSGGNVPAKLSPFTNYQVPYAERVINEAGLLAGAVGMITDPIKANQIVEERRGDIVLIGRAVLREPFWPIQAAKALGHKVETAPQYKYGFWGYF